MREGKPRRTELDVPFPPVRRERIYDFPSDIDVLNTVDIIVHKAIGGEEGKSRQAQNSRDDANENWSMMIKKANCEFNYFAIHHPALLDSHNVNGEDFDSFFIHSDIDLQAAWPRTRFGIQWFTDILCSM